MQFNKNALWTLVDEHVCALLSVGTRKQGAPIFKLFVP